MITNSAAVSAQYAKCNRLAIAIGVPPPPLTTTPSLVGRKYHERVIDHYENPRNVGKFTKQEETAGTVGTGLVGAPACGDVMRLQLKINNGVVEDAKFKTFGCGSAIASSSLATEWVKGKTIEECLEIKNTQIAQHLALPPVKLHCSMLAEDAIRAAIKDYQEKQKKKEDEDQL